MTDETVLESDSVSHRPATPSADTGASVPSVVPHATLLPRQPRSYGSCTSNPARKIQCGGHARHTGMHHAGSFIPSMQEYRVGTTRRIKRQHRRRSWDWIRWGPAGAVHDLSGSHSSMESERASAMIEGPSDCPSGRLHEHIPRPDGGWHNGCYFTPS